MYKSDFQIFNSKIFLVTPTMEQSEWVIFTSIVNFCRTKSQYHCRNETAYSQGFVTVMARVETTRQPSDLLG